MFKYKNLINDINYICFNVLYACFLFVINNSSMFSIVIDINIITVLCMHIFNEILLVVIINKYDFKYCYLLKSITSICN